MYRTKSAEHITLSLVTFTVFSSVEQASMLSIFVLMLEQEGASALLI
jgi:hypothetical protein